MDRDSSAGKLDFLFDEAERESGGGFFATAVTPMGPIRQMNEPTVPSLWDLALSAWVIQDGNYRDFEVGQTAEFAVQFGVSDRFGQWPARSPISAIYVGECRYNAVAEVLFRDDNITVLDIGIRCYGDEHSPLPPPSVSQGARIATCVRLEVDAFANFEAPDQTPLVHSWKVQAILIQTAPWIEEPISRVRIRDQNRLGWKEIPRTDAWKDDGGYAEYILRCELLPIPPKNTSATWLAYWP